MEEEKKIDDADTLVAAAVSPRKVRTEKEDFVKAPIESPPMSFKAGGGNNIKRKETNHWKIIFEMYPISDRLGMYDRGNSDASNRYI